MLDAIKFDESGLAPQSDYEGGRLWRTPDGDTVAVFFHNMAPDIKVIFRTSTTPEGFTLDLPVSQVWE